MKRAVKIIYLTLVAVCLALMLLWNLVLLITLCFGIDTEEGWIFAAVYIAALLAALPLSILLHELGHMLFGAIVKIRAIPHFSIAGSSSCKIIPKTDKNLRGRLICTTIGGLVINFIVIIVGITVQFIIRYFSYMWLVWLWLLTFPLATASFFVFAYNIFPNITGNGKTDGLVAYELIKNDDSARVTLSVLCVQAQILKGKPIEEVDEKLLFDVPVIREDDPAFISLTELRYEYFAARGDTEQAKMYKDRFEQLKIYL